MTFYWSLGLGIVLGAFLQIIGIQALALQLKVNQLPNRHSPINPHGLFYRDFQGPEVTEADIALACRSMNINAQAPNATFAF